MRDLVETVIGQVMRRDPQQGVAARKVAVPHVVVHPLTPASSTEVPALKGRDEALWKASVKFEAMFMQQMMTAMRKSVPSSGFMPQGFAEKSYASMMDQAMADAGSQQGSLGIASAIYRQLKHDHGSSHGAVQAAATASDKLKMLAADRYRSMATDAGQGDQ
ncbi:MAG: rod-binding protein [Mariprofundales bacterium]|nr:rod-binding protein [Mariprofundales bacterium]